MSTFDELAIPPKVLENLKAQGFNSPTQIQELTIKPSMDGKDIIGIAQTGTGKTGAYTIPLVIKLLSTRSRARLPRGLILTPTRELASQVYEFFESITEGIPLKKSLLIGGVSFLEQSKILNVGADVIIGTPGRISDHIERNNIMLHGVQTFIIDEADRMMDEGFIPQVKEITSKIPLTRQTLLFSATMDSVLNDLINSFLSNPTRVEISPQASVSEKIEQSGFLIQGSNESEQRRKKSNALLSILEELNNDIRNGIIFCNTKKKVDQLTTLLTSNGVSCTSIHGNHSQVVRSEVLENFRNGNPKFLIATDVASRGLDISFVSHVFNYDIPTNPEDYIHRIGRTGRAGKHGKAISFCQKNEQKILNEIEKLMKQKIQMQELEQRKKPKDTPSEEVPSFTDPNIVETSQSQSDEESKNRNPIQFRVEKNLRGTKFKQKGKQNGLQESPEILESEEDIEEKNNSNISTQNNGETLQNENIKKRISKKGTKSKKRESKNSSEEIKNIEAKKPPSQRNSKNKNSSLPSREEVYDTTIGFEGRIPAFMMNGN